MTDLYPLRSEMKDVTLVWRVSETPDLRTGELVVVYDSVPLKAVILPVAYTLRVGEQRTGDLNLHGSYYDQHRRQFLFEFGHQQLVNKNWLIAEGRRYEIESVEEGPESVLRVTGRQEDQVEVTNYIIVDIRTTIYTGETLDDQS
jgi:hypothetical protein